MTTDKTVIITNEDFSDEFETYQKYYICQNCGEEKIREYDKYCSECGHKIIWKLDEDRDDNPKKIYIITYTDEFFTILDVFIDTAKSIKEAIEIIEDHGTNDGSEPIIVYDDFDRDDYKNKFLTYYQILEKEV